MKEQHADMLGDVVTMAESQKHWNNYHCTAAKELEQLILDNGIFEFVAGVTEETDTDDKVLLPTAKGFRMGRLHDESPKARAKRKQKRKTKRRRRR